MSSTQVADRPKSNGAHAPAAPAPTSARIEQGRAERRRRSDLGTGRLDQLAVTGTLDPNYVYRWVNDTPGRVHQLTQMDDWDVVTDQDRGEKDKGLGTGSERVVDRSTGLKAVLVRKPKDYYTADKAKEQASLVETEASLKRGQSNSPDALQGPAAYVPAGGISISNGAKNSSSSYTP